MTNLETHHSFSTRIDAVFRIEGLNFTPKELNRDLGIEPSETKSPDQAKISIPSKRSTFGFWALKSSAGEFQNLECHLNGFLNIFEPKAKKLKQIVERNANISVVCGIFALKNVLEGGNYFSISSKALTRLGVLGAELEIYFYNVMNNPYSENP